MLLSKSAQNYLFLRLRSSTIIEGEKWYKEGVNEAIQNYVKPYKDRILSVSFPLHFCVSIECIANKTYIVRGYTTVIGIQ